MPPSSGSALALAARLRSFDEGTLLALLRAREVRTTGIRDVFDLAERLLSADSVDEALSRLPRPDLAALAQAVPSDTSTTLALADDEGRPYDAVRQALERWPARGLPSPDELADPAPPALGSVSGTDPAVIDARAAEHAYAATSAVRELIAALDDAPARELVRGGIALPDARRLAAAARVTLDELGPLIALAESAGLAVRDGGEWTTTPEAVAWSTADAPERWAHLAIAWAGALQPDVRAVLADRPGVVWGEGLVDYVRWLYPAGGEWMQERVSSESHAAEVLGVASGGVSSTAGIAVVAGDAERAAAAVREKFPHPVESAYLQHDLTIVSTGPLAAPLDARLRTMADAEGAGLAGSYRVNAASLERALRGGDDAASIRSFLESISLTGLPQPLAYLIDESARRHALVRVGSRAGGSYVRSADDALLRTIAVDAAITVLGLRAEGDRLVSGLRPEVLLWALTDARYPVALEDADGTIVSAERPTAVSTTAPREDPHAALVARLAAADDPAHGDGWLERQLDTAIRGRTAVKVLVQLPGGDQTEYVLEPTGLGGGRLRGRDKSSDIERTLPLSSVLDVTSAD